MDVVGPLVFDTQRLLVLQITVAISAVPHLDEHQSCEGEGDELERHGCDEKSPSPQLKLALLATVLLHRCTCLCQHTTNHPHTVTRSAGQAALQRRLWGEYSRIIFMMHCTIRYPHFHDGNLFTFTYLHILKVYPNIPLHCH